MINLEAGIYYVRRAFYSKLFQILINKHTVGIQFVIKAFKAFKYEIL